MKRSLAIASLTMFILSVLLTPTIAKDLRSLKLLYIGDKGTQRESEYAGFLREQVASVDLVDQHIFDPATAGAYDVVLLEWPQSEETREMRKLTSPLGAREKWGRPTVLLGSAGLNLAVAWKAKGGSGCTCMDPLAYGLREHEIFDAPFKIDRTKTTAIPTPADFKAEIKEPTIQVIPLVTDVNEHFFPGWCSYSNDFAANPDVEFFCGGVNHKTPTAAGLWRQGNLLHFGFDLSPTQMNETGRHLLLNSIAYISRFTQDRPIAITPSVFAGKVAPSRGAIVRRLKDPEYKIEWIAETISPQLWAPLAGKSRDQILAWAQANSKFLRPDEDARLVIDQDLQALNITFDQSEFLSTVVSQLRSKSPDEQARGRRLIKRYLPDIDSSTISADVLEQWINTNRPYMFASDSSDYRWYIDPLARQRGIASSDLRGPKRGDAQ